MSGMSAALFSQLRNSTVPAASPTPSRLAAVPLPSAKDPVPPPVRAPAISMSTPVGTAYFSLDANQVIGLAAVDKEDRSRVEELISYAATIKCPDKNYDSKTYERPSWIRIESGNEEYILLLGGWHDLDFRQLQLIHNFDIGVGEGRNLVDMKVLNAAPNTNPSVRELTLFIRYRSDRLRRRMIASSLSEGVADAEKAATYGVPHDDGAPRKKRSFGASVIEFLFSTD